MKPEKKTGSKNHKASVLAVSLIIMGVMIVIALGISSSSLQSRKSSIGSSKSNVAFQNADSGVEVVMQKIKDHSSDANLNNFDNTDGLCDGILNLPGKYKSELKKTDGTPVVCGDPVREIATIKSTGYSSQDSRAIEAEVINSAMNATITIRARGVVGSEQIELTVSGSLIDTWTLSTSYQDYTTSAAVSPSDTIRVEFVNDNGSRDVRVDYMIVGGVTYQAEAQVINTGGWNAAMGACGGAQSEWLHCNGYIEFPM